MRKQREGTYLREILDERMLDCDKRRQNQCRPRLLMLVVPLTITMKELYFESTLVSLITDLKRGEKEIKYAFQFMADLQLRI